jgi:thiol-disulfide isomerase/thioredoxin
MNKKSLVIVTVIVGLFLIGGGVFAYSNNQNNNAEQEKMATENTSMMKKDEPAMTTKNDQMTKDTSMSKSGSYVTLAEYTNDPSKYADSTKVYFFHASWCPICQGIDKEINMDTSKIPAGVTVIKADFDSSTELRKKYGVTTQYTFIQVDNNGNETGQWSATSLQKAIAGIKS